MSTQATTLALLPGFMLDDALWDDFVPLLPADWAVQRITLPRGRTVHEVADAVAEQLDAPAMFLGFSMGGYVARALAAVHPQLVDALVLVATSAREQAPSAQQVNLAGRAVFKGLSRSAIQRSLSTAHAEDQVLIDRVHAMSLRLGHEAFVWQSVLDRSGVPLDGIACPTLVVAADQDRLRSVAESQEIVDAIDGAALQIVQGAGHLIPLEDPQSLAGIIVEWANRQVRL
ncbi:MAG: alpha/beta fold hydrolase [Luteimonas sp.]